MTTDNKTRAVLTDNEVYDIAIREWKSYSSQPYSPDGLCFAAIAVRDAVMRSLAAHPSDSAETREPVAWSYECRQPFTTDPVIWAEFFGKKKPDASKPWIRNVTPLYSAHAQGAKPDESVETVRCFDVDVQIGSQIAEGAQAGGAREPYIVGNQYRTQSGDLVRFVKVHNAGTSYETMEDEQGVNRYTQRDFGRCTGSAHDYSDPRNTPPLFAAMSREQPKQTYSEEWGDAYLESERARSTGEKDNG